MITADTVGMMAADFWSGWSDPSCFSTASSWVVSVCSGALDGAFTLIIRVADAPMPSAVDAATEHVYSPGVRPSTTADVDPAGTMVCLAIVESPLFWQATMKFLIGEDSSPAGSPKIISTLPLALTSISLIDGAFGRTTLLFACSGFVGGTEAAVSSSCCGFCSGAAFSGVFTYMVAEPDLDGLKIGVGFEFGELMARGKRPSVAPRATMLHE